MAGMRIMIYTEVDGSQANVYHDTHRVLQMPIPPYDGILGSF